MIIVIANSEYDEKTGRTNLITSHGIDSESLEHVVLQPVHPQFLGAVFNTELGEFVIYE